MIKNNYPFDLAKCNKYTCKYHNYKTPFFVQKKFIYKTITS